MILRYSQMYFHHKNVLLRLEMLAGLVHGNDTLYRYICFAVARVFKSFFTFNMNLIPVSWEIKFNLLCYYYLSKLKLLYLSYFLIWCFPSFYLRVARKTRSRERRLFKIITETNHINFPPNNSSSDS